MFKTLLLTAKGYTASKILSINFPTLRRIRALAENGLATAFEPRLLKQLRITKMNYRMTEYQRNQ